MAEKPEERKPGEFKKGEIPEFAKMTDDVFNMVWTAGLNSGMKVQFECSEGMMTHMYEVDKRVQELINKDADGIVELLKLKKQMGQ